MERPYYIFKQEDYDNVRQQIVAVSGKVIYYLAPNEDGVFNEVGFTYNDIDFVNADNVIKPISVDKE